MFEPPRKRFGLTEDQRKEVFYKLVEAEDRADKKAGIDDVRKYDEDKAERLKGKYVKRIRKKHEITKKQASRIIAEGIQKGWPLPQMD